MESSFDVEPSFPLRTRLVSFIPLWGHGGRGGGVCVHEFVFFEEVGAPKKEERYKIECPEKSV